MDRASRAMKYLPWRGELSPSWHLSYPLAGSPLCQRPLWVSLAQKSTQKEGTTMRLSLLIPLAILMAILCFASSSLRGHLQIRDR